MHTHSILCTQGKTLILTIPCTHTGMGDSAHGSIEPIITLLKEKLGAFVLSIATAKGSYADMISSYYGNVNDQVRVPTKLLTLAF